MNILIVGSRGAYGSWIYKRLVGKFGGHSIRGIDKKEAKDVGAYAMLSRVIINCASMSSSEAVIRDISSSVCKSSFIVDLTTSKKEVCPILSNATCDYVLLHPMSAPPDGDTALPLETPVYVVEENIRNEENLKWYTLLCQIMGGTFKKVSLPDHNRIEEIIQSVPHRLVMAFAEAVIVSGYTLDEVEALATPVSKPLCEAVRRHFSKGNADTFAELQRLASRSSKKPMGAMTAKLEQIDRLSELRMTKTIRDEWKEIKAKLGL